MLPLMKSRDIIYHSIHRRVTIHCTNTHDARGSHIRVACRSVCNHDQESWSVKIILVRLIALFRSSLSLDFAGVQRTKPCHTSIVSKKVRWLLTLVAQNSSWSLDWLQKRVLITWFHFDPSHKHFYRWRVCDYPLIVAVLSQLGVAKISLGDIGTRSKLLR